MLRLTLRRRGHTIDRNDTKKRTADSHSTRPYWAVLHIWSRDEPISPPHSPKKSRLLAEFFNKRNFNKEKRNHMEIITQTAIAVPREIDERVITAAIQRGEIIPHISKPTGTIAVGSEVHQGQNNYFHA